MAEEKESNLNRVIYLLNEIKSENNSRDNYDSLVILERNLRNFMQAFGFDGFVSFSIYPVFSIRVDSMGWLGNAALYELGDGSFEIKRGSANFDLCLPKKLIADWLQFRTK